MSQNKLLSSQLVIRRKENTCRKIHPTRLPIIQEYPRKGTVLLAVPETCVDKIISPCIIQAYLQDIKEL